MRHACILACLLAAVPAAAQKIGEVPRHEPGRGAPPGEVLEWTTPEGQPYWYRVPRPGKGKPNLLLMLHGTGLKWGWAFWNYPIASGQFRPGDIVVAPEGLTPGSGDSFNFVQGPKDGDQIANLVKTFQKSFDIGQVYVYGHSQGAFFSYWFAGEHPELVNGIVAHAGNVLDVKHSKLSRERVAIGILHGRADAVVPVECAYRTEQVYQDQGYVNVKLQVVEGLTEQSGHWPLPVQVAGMLDWLDRVCEATPGGVLEGAWAELAKPAPDLEVLAGAAQRAAGLLKKYRGDDKGGLAARLERLVGFLDEAARGHAAALVAAGADAKARDYAAWMAHFRSVDRALARNRTWKQEAKAFVARAAREQKAVQGVTRALSDQPGERAWSAALKVIEGTGLAAGIETLLGLFGRQVESPPRGVAGELVQQARELLGARRALDEEGRRAASELTARLAAALLETEATAPAGDG